MRLDVTLVHGFGRVFAFEDYVGVGEPLIEIATFVDDTRCGVRGSLGCGVDTAGDHAVVQDRGTVSECVVDGEHVGELFVDNLDGRSGGSGNLSSGCCDGRNGVALPQHLASGQDLLGHEDVVGLGTGFGQVRQVSSGDDRVHTRHGFGGRGVDRHDAGMGMW